MNLMPRRSWLTEDDVRRVVREELERAKPHSAESCQSCTGNALEGIVRSMEKAVQKLEEAVEPANNHSPHLRRANAKSTAKSDARNLQLQLQTKLSLPIYTGKKLEGKGGDPISVALIDADTGKVVTSGRESSIKLDVVVLEGDFKKDDDDSWAQKEFEDYLVKQREGKRPLLAGNLQVMLRQGVGELGELIFTDNSSWNRSKMFRIGLKVASGYHVNSRIREAKTDAFAVKEHRGESYKKNYPPKSDDEVWRLEKIAKDGKSHKKLSEAEIHKVEDFLLQLFIDSDKLREILGKSIKQKSWDSLVCHAKTCKISRKIYLYYLDGMRKHGALFDADRQLIGLIKDREYFATHRLSGQEKEHGDTIVKNAFDNLNDVMEFNGETFSSSMQKKISSSFTPQIRAAPGGLEALQANVGLTVEGHNDVTAMAWSVEPPNTNPTNDKEFSVDEIPFERHPIFRDSLDDLVSPGDNGNTIFGLPVQSHDINIQFAMCSQTIHSWSPMDYTVNEHGVPSGPTYAPASSFQSRNALPLSAGIHGMEDFRSPDSDDITVNQLAGVQHPSDDDTFQTSQCHVSFPTGNAFARWIRIFLVLKRFCHIRKRRARVGR
ncbi:hypothetical protein BT93_E2502 [Corymbia citriodora subsp. variegata]|nr:hypothetical protein BT93_E2502 [Corymbia citriodora subsp. variegata]